MQKKFSQIRSKCPIGVDRRTLIEKQEVPDSRNIQLQTKVQTDNLKFLTQRLEQIRVPADFEKCTTMRSLGSNSASSFQRT